MLKSIKKAIRESRIMNNNIIIHRNQDAPEIISPHKNKSREVKNEDVDRVLLDGQKLIDLCSSGFGKYPSAYAVAHPQITDKDPLRFFVLQNGIIIVNPVMVKHTKTCVNSSEGCLSFSDKPEKNVDRYHKSEFVYQTIIKDGEKQVLSPKQYASLSGRDSFIWQHETDHLDAKYIY